MPPSIRLGSPPVTRLITLRMAASLVLKVAVSPGATPNRVKLWNRLAPRTVPRLCGTLKRPDNDCTAPVLPSVSAAAWAAAAAAQAKIDGATVQSPTRMNGARSNGCLNAGSAISSSCAARNASILLP